MIFRAESLPQATRYLGAMFIPRAEATPDLVLQALTPMTAAILILGGLCFVMPREGRPATWLARPGSSSFEIARTTYLVLALALSGLLVLTSGFSPFLYFRF